MLIRCDVMCVVKYEPSVYANCCCTFLNKLHDFSNRCFQLSSVLPVVVHTRARRDPTFVKQRESRISQKGNCELDMGIPELTSLVLKFIDIINMMFS
jgi:hypothetical protein